MPCGLELTSEAERALVRYPGGVLMRREEVTHHTACAPQSTLAREVRGSSSVHVVWN